MSSKTKHSKIRNTGILFELLTRQITVDVLNNDKKGSAANILKEFFNKNTQLGKEYELYRVLTVENYKSETKANHLVDAVLSARVKLNDASLKREKYLHCESRLWRISNNIIVTQPLKNTYVYI